MEEATGGVGTVIAGERSMAAFMGGSFMASVSSLESYYA
jgi:hypothetical protein